MYRVPEAASQDFLGVLETCGGFPKDKWFLRLQNPIFWKKITKCDPHLVKPNHESLLTSWLTGMVIAVYLDRTQICLQKNKATGWLGALVRVTNLKFWFMRVRDKMLVFAGVVKKCLQHGHSFRLARRVTQEWKFGVSPAQWLDFALQGSKKTLEIYDFQPSDSYQGGVHSSSFFLFSTLAVPERLWQRRSHSLQQGSVCDAMSSCRPKCTFFCAPLFFWRSMDGGRHFFKCFHVPSMCWVPATMVL